MKKYLRIRGIFILVVFVVFLFTLLIPVKHSLAYPRSYPYLVSNSLPAFSARGFNEALLARVLREIIIIYKFLAQIERVLNERGENDFPSLGRVIGDRPQERENSQNTPPKRSNLREEPAGNRHLDPENPSAKLPEGSSSSPAGSLGKIKIAIIDIDSKHAAEVKAVMEETIRRKNPGAKVEIRTIILPGKWQRDGSKAVATSDILDAFAEAKAWGAKVINMSIGAQGGVDGIVLSALRDLSESGILVVAASGNEGSYDAWGQAGRYVLSVGVRGAPYSNTADLYVDWGELPPGLEGTSFAAPIIAAEAALAWLENPSLNLASLPSQLGSRDTVYARSNPPQRSSQGFHTSAIEFVRPPVVFYTPVEEMPFYEQSFYSPVGCFPSFW
ncbi:MAG: S8 family serine peptidase [Candidatus Omnitrophica bacterium]|nr:S8 family serine peptidase [Candidatus Omnitrophota bacterium]